MTGHVAGAAASAGGVQLLSGSCINLVLTDSIPVVDTTGTCTRYSNNLVIIAEACTVQVWGWFLGYQHPVGNHVCLYDPAWWKALSAYTLLTWLTA